MRRARWLAVVVLAGLTAPAAWAQPATRPDDRPMPGGRMTDFGPMPGGPMPDGPMPGRREGEGMRPNAPPPPEGWRRGRGPGAIPREERYLAYEFVREHMPHLYAAMDQYERRSPARLRLMGFAWVKYRQLQRIQEENPELYSRILEQVKSEDEVFKIIAELREAPPEQKGELRQRLREKLREIVGNFLEERERRIAHLRKIIEREEAQLVQERANIEAMIDQRMKALQEELPPAGDPSTTAPADMRGRP